MNKICVYAICKNEVNNLDKWIESMSEADYIVVLDTGSTDGTFEKLKEDPRIFKTEQKIYKHFRFDKARNDSMKLIPDDANILVCTDIDETFNKGWAKTLKEKWQSNTTRCYYKYIWSHNSLGEEENVFTYDKIHTRDYEWHYPVHEVLVKKDNSFIENPINLFNSIILDHWRKDKDRKFYFALLKLAVKENPQDAHIRMLLAREYFLAHDFENAIKVYLETLKLPTIDDPSNRLVLLCSLFQLSLSYYEDLNFDEALWYSQELIKEDPTYREPYLIMADCYNHMHMYTLAEGVLKSAREYSYQHYDWLEHCYSYHGWLEDTESITKFNLNKLDEAIADIKLALDHNPDDVRLLKNLNGYYVKKIEKLENNKQNKNGGKQILYE